MLKQSNTVAITSQIHYLIMLFIFFFKLSKVKRNAPTNFKRINFKSYSGYEIKKGTHSN